MKWRVAVSKDGTKQHTNYFTIEADTAKEAERLALQKKGVRSVKWVAEPDPNRERS
jgi:hypothetical protein